MENTIQLYPPVPLAEQCQCGTGQPPPFLKVRPLLPPPGHQNLMSRDSSMRGRGKASFPGLAIKMPIIHTKTQATICFLNQDNWGTIRVVALSDHLHLKQFINMLFDHLILRRRNAPIALPDRNIIQEGNILSYQICAAEVPIMGRKVGLVLLEKRFHLVLLLGGQGRQVCGLYLIRHHGRNEQPLWLCWRGSQ